MLAYLELGLEDAPRNVSGRGGPAMTDEARDEVAPLLELWELPVEEAPRLAVGVATAAVDVVDDATEVPPMV